MFISYSGKSCFKPNIKRLPPTQFPLIKYPLRATTAILHPHLLQTLPAWGLAKGGSRRGKSVPGLYPLTVKREGVCSIRLHAGHAHSINYQIKQITISQFPARPFRRFGQNRRTSVLGNRINKFTCKT